MHAPCRILVANIGYARDIDGSAARHILRSGRNLYVPPAKQRRALDACKTIVRLTQPDLCCFIEVDSGSPASGGLDQFAYLGLPEYPHRDIVSKYVSRKLQRSLLTRGKSNGWMAAKPYPSQRLFLSHGSKRLLYRIQISDDCALFFTHLSLRRMVRLQQLEELRAIADRETGDVIIAGDFNIFAGLSELDIVLGDGRYVLMNDRNHATFRLFRRKYLLDLCIASARLAPHISVKVIDQPYSDHDALLITLRTATTS